MANTYPLPVGNDKTTSFMGGGSPSILNKMPQLTDAQVAQSGAPASSLNAAQLALRSGDTQVVTDTSGVSGKVTDLQGGITGLKSTPPASGETPVTPSNPIITPVVPTIPVTTTHSGTSTPTEPPVVPTGTNPVPPTSGNVVMKNGQLGTVDPSTGNFTPISGGSQTGGVTGGTPPTPPVQGQYTPEQRAQINAAGQAQATQYDSVIQQTLQHQQQQMAKNLINAGEAGGFMSSQVSGMAAIAPTVGADWIGVGGILSRTSNDYNSNIQNLELQKIAAVSNAESQLGQYFDTGNQQNFNNAMAQYQNAQTAIGNQQSAQYQYIQELLGLQKLNQTLSSPISSADPAIQKEAVNLITKYPSVVTSLQSAGVDPMSLNYEQLAQAVSNTKEFKQEQIKAIYGTGNYGDYQQAKAAGDFTGSYQQWLAANKSSTTINISGSTTQTPAQIISSGWNLNDSSLPDPTKANIVDPSLGRTPNAIFQDAISYGLRGGNLQQYVGGLSSGGQSAKVKNVIDNKSAAIAADAGVDRATVQQEFAANSSAINKQVDFMNTVQRALNGAESGGTLTQTLFANKGIDPNSSTWVNTKLNDLTKKFGNSGEIRAYQAAMAEIGNEYAQVFARGGQRSESGTSLALDLTNGNVKLSDIQTTLDTLQAIGKTVIQTSVQQVQSISSGGGTDAVAAFLAQAHGVSIPTGSAGDQYSQYRASVPTGSILIKRNGQVGSVPTSEFNSSTDTKL